MTFNCPTCGAVVGPGSVFCSNCGRSLAGAPVADPTPGSWQLTVAGGPSAGLRFPLGEFTGLGRGQDNQIRLQDGHASRHHAVIQRHPNGYAISDLGSSNGTSVNGVRITQPTWLRQGDLVTIGSITFRVESQQPAPQPAPTPPVPHPHAGPVPHPHAGPVPPHYAGPMPPTYKPTPTPPAPHHNAGPIPPTYQPAPASQQAAPSGEPVVGIIPALELSKGLFARQTFNLVLTPYRLVFARLTSEMLNQAARQAKQAARQEGKGFFGQWGAVMNSNASICEGYYHAPIDTIIAGHPDNFVIPIQQIRKIQVQRGAFDEDNANPDQLIIHAGRKMKFDLKTINAGKAKKILRDALGGIVK